MIQLNYVAALAFIAVAMCWSLASLLVGGVSEKERVLGHTLEI